MPSTSVEMRPCTVIPCLLSLEISKLRQALNTRGFASEKSIMPDSPRFHHNASSLNPVSRRGRRAESCILGSLLYLHQCLRRFRHTIPDQNLGRVLPFRARSTWDSVLWAGRGHNENHASLTRLHCVHVFSPSHVGPFPNDGHLPFSNISIRPIVKRVGSGRFPGCAATSVAQGC
jgi:hypothetical protein